MEKKGANHKPVRIGLMTMWLGVLLNPVQLRCVLPDWGVRVVGIATMICTVLPVFFTVREAAMSSAGKESGDM